MRMVATLSAVLALAALVALLAAAAVVGRSAGVSGCEMPVVLEVVEANSRGLRHLPLNQAPSLSDARGASPSAGWWEAFFSGRIRVGYQVEAAGVCIFSRWYSPTRLPWRLPLGTPLVVTGGVVDGVGVSEFPGGEAISEVNIVDNAGRLVPGDVMIRAVDAAGRVDLVVAGEHVDLEPGASWTRVWVLPPGGVGPVTPDEGSPTIGRALADDRPVTRLTIVNRGRIPVSTTGSRSRRSEQEKADGR